MSLRINILALLALAILPSVAFSADKVTYKNDVKPILREHCFACHNQDDPTASLALDSFEGLITGGASGEVLAAGDLDGSRLWKLVTHEEEPTMPPDNKVPDKQLQVLRAWIEGGLLKEGGSKPVKRKISTITKIDTSKLGQPVGQPAMPEGLFHEPVLWAPHTGPVDTIATSPWAPLLAIAWQRQITFYNTDTHDLLGILPYVDGVPQVVRFSRDSSLLLVAGGRNAAAGSAALFDVKTGARLATLGDELDIVLAADISPDLSLVAIGGPKKKVLVYRVSDGTLAYKINKHTDWVTALGFSPDGRLLASADRNGGALLWQAAAGHERGDLRGHKGAITSLDWRADSAMLATSSEDGTVRLWNSAGQQIKSVAAHPGGALSVRFSKAGNWVSAGRDHHVKTWKSSGAAIADLGKMPGIVLTAAFTHNGAKVIASDYTGEVRVLDTASKTQVTTLEANPLLLAQRLANAEKALLQTEKKLQANETEVATAQQQLQQAEQTKATVIAQQTRFSKAMEQLADQAKQRQTQQQELAKQSGELETEHQQAAQKLSHHRSELADVASQLQAIQTKLTELQSTESTLQEQESKLTTELAAIQAAFAKSQQQLKFLETSQKDFSAAKALRKAYAEPAE